MMKIKTENFKKYKKLINFFLDKETQIGNCLYLDFENKKVYVRGDRKKVRFSFDYEGEAYSNIFVKASDFFTLCDRYEEIEFNGERFTQDNGIYKFESFIKDIDFEFEKNINELANATLELNTELKSKIVKAVDYIEEVNGSARNALFFQSGYMIGIHPFSRCFETKLDTEVPDFELSYDTVKMLLLLSEKDHIQIKSYSHNEEEDYENEYGYVYIDINDKECETLIFKDSGYDLPSMREPSVIAKYSHKNTLKINRIELLEMLKFLSPFLKDIDNYRINMIIEEKTILLEIVEEIIQIKKHVPILDVSANLVGNSYWFNLNTFKILTKTFKDEVLTFYMFDKEGKDIPSIVNLISEEDKDTHVFMLELTD
jgi:hypothetical protein